MGTLNRRTLLLALPAAVLPAFRNTAHGATRVVDPVRLASAVLGPGPAPAGDPTLLVAGPADAGPGTWASLLAPRLGAALQAGGVLPVSATGGRDGVTGANAFEALTAPDGATALLVPGSAAIAWLAGDPRVHFDAARWVPALAALSSAVLVVRRGAAISPATLRTAASTLTGPELPALLGLSMLGIDPAPVFGLSEAVDAAAALEDGRVDAVFLFGSAVPERLAALTARGHRPLFTLGGGEDGSGRDPLFPAIPGFVERLHGRSGLPFSAALFAAWRAAAAAVRIDVALVLPLLAPPALVARWRTACQAASTDLALLQAAAAAGVRAVPAPGCVQALSRIDAGETAQLALRRWIAGRPG